MTLTNPTSPDAYWQGHLLTLNQVSGQITCTACPLELDASVIIAGAVPLPADLTPCPGTEEGRRLLAEREREENPLLSVITEPCVAVPPEWEGTEAEAIGLAVAGAVADLVAQRDQQAAETAKAMDLLAALVRSFPPTSFAASNIALQEAKDYLGVGIDPSPDQ